MGNVNRVCIQAHQISGFSPVWFLTVLCSWTLRDLVPVRM